MWRRSSGTCVCDVCYVPELVIPVGVSLVEGCCYHGSYWTKGSPWLSWSHHFEGCIWVTGGHGCVPVVMGTSQTVSLFVTYRRICCWIDTTDATSGAGAAFPSGTPVFVPDFGGVHVLLAIVLADFLWFMDSDYPFGIFKLFLHTYIMYTISRISAQVASCLIL